jgi:probable F420-dependent oxidoreductase
MKVGSVFPQTETSPDPGPIREYAQAVEELGYAHVVLYDHVLGASPDRPGGWRGPYTDTDPFHEVFVVLGYIAAVTARIELATGVLVLPQRQTALVAKQAAEVDLLSNGRLRLGVGLGWNAVEYEALGMDFRTRGRRTEEQLEVMRLLWTNPVVDFHGEFHDITLAGINPMPTRSIPVWMGGTAPAAKERIARVADGWMVNTPTEKDPKAAVADMRQRVGVAGREPDEFGIEVRIALSDGVEKAVEQMSEYHDLGVSHVTVNTMRGGLSWPEGHIDALRRFAAANHGG